MDPRQCLKDPSKHRFHLCLQSISRLVEPARQIIAFQISYKPCKSYLAKNSNIYSACNLATRLWSCCRIRERAACQHLNNSVWILSVTISTIAVNDVTYHIKVGTNRSLSYKYVFSFQVLWLDSDNTGLGYCFWFGLIFVLLFCTDHIIVVLLLYFVLCSFILSS